MRSGDRWKRLCFPCETCDESRFLNVWPLLNCRSLLLVIVLIIVTGWFMRCLMWPHLGNGLPSLQLDRCQKITNWRLALAAAIWQCVCVCACTVKYYMQLLQWLCCGFRKSVIFLWSWKHLSVFLPFQVLCAQVVPFQRNHTIQATYPMRNVDFTSLKVQGDMNTFKSLYLVCHPVFYWALSVWQHLFVVPHNYHTYLWSRRMLCMGLSNYHIFLNDS